MNFSLGKFVSVLRHKLALCTKSSADRRRKSDLCAVL